ncbi:MAG: hypothetical protein ACI8PT_005024, partial [Gammaproteobacteria bacterium]
MSFWSQHSFSENQCASFEIGPLRFWLHRTRDEWRVAQEYGEKPNACVHTLDADVPGSADWQRWIAVTDRRVRLVPAMPDRPVIVRPEARFAISPGASGTFYVRIPVWVRLVVGDKDTLLSELPTILLSNSWFGAPDDGDFCYSLRTTAQRDLDAYDPQPFRARCAVHVANRSATDELNIQRLCLRARSLSVYEHKGMLKTNDIKVDYHGEDQLPDVEHLAGPPAADAALLCESRD